MTTQDSGRFWGALAASLGTTSIYFVRRVLVFERVAWPPPCVQIVAWNCSLMSGVLFWASLISVSAEFSEQVTLATLSTLLAWSSVVLVVNETYRLPSRQQLGSLGFYAAAEISVVLQARLLFGQ